jgi:hypothetical protein
MKPKRFLLNHEVISQSFPYHLVASGLSAIPQELSTESSHAPLIIMASLATICALASTHRLLVRGVDKSGPLFLFFSNDSPGLEDALDRLLSPLRFVQKSSHDVQELRSDRKIIQSAKDSFLTGSGIIDPSHEAYFDNRLRQFQPNGLIYVCDPQPGDLGGLASSKQPVLVHASGFEANDDLLHIAKTWKHTNRDQRETKCIENGGSISLIATGAFDALTNVWNEPKYKGFAENCFVIAAPSSTPNVSTPCKGQTAFLIWEKFLHYQMGNGDDKLPHTVSTEAEMCVLEFAQALKDQNRFMTISPQPCIDQCYRLMRVLHVCENGSPGEISKDYATRACSIVSWLWQERFRFERQIKKSGLKEAAEVMMGKIKAKHPITARNLFRTYDKQSSTLHEPVLNYLIAGNQVIKGSDGSLIPNKISQNNTATDPLTHCKD